MRAVRLQYLLTFAVLGSYTPFAPFYFDQQHLNATLIGYIMAAASVAVVMSPVLITLLADSHLDARRLMAVLFVLGAAGLAAMPALHTFWPILLLWVFYNVTSVSLAPLQDGINFSIQERRRSEGKSTEPYHRVRVWGTVGYILPCIAIYIAMRHGMPVGVSWAVAAGFSVLAAVNALSLPDPRASAVPTASGLPTVAAARALLRPPLLVFCLALFLLQMASAPYYAYYSIYLTRQVHLDPQWIGPINNIGPIFEILFVLGFGRFVRLFGLRWVLAGGLLLTAVRVGMLALWPTPAVAIGTQVMHGALVLVLQVAPPVFLNRHAGDRWRHSIQGIYTMLVIGGGRIVGNLVGGPIARHSLTAVFGFSAIVVAVVAALVLVAFVEADHEPAENVSSAEEVESTMAQTAAPEA